MLAIVLGVSTASCSFSAPNTEIQGVGAGVERWTSFAFEDGGHIVLVKTPPGFREFPASIGTFQQPAFDTTGDRYLLQNQYDFGRPDRFELAQFIVRAHFTKLRSELPTLTPDKFTLSEAFSQIPGRAMSPDMASGTGIEMIGARQWVHFDYGTQELYATLVDKITVLTITGVYGKKLRADKAMLGTRKRTLKQILEEVLIRSASE
jgi:hypothetical protein